MSIKTLKKVQIVITAYIHDLTWLKKKIPFIQYFLKK
jgi:hypothetical protein